MFELIALTLANMGTPLMLQQATHLLIGNAIIGIIEGVLLASIFKARPVRAILLLIVANYASALLGFGLFSFMEVSSLAHRIITPTIYTYRQWLVGVILFCFVLTVVVEYAFVWFAFAKVHRQWKPVMKANIVVQICTYVCCIGLPYFFTSNVQLASEAKIAPINVMGLNEQPYWIYYINTNDGDVWRMRLDGSGDSRILNEDLTSRSLLFLWGEGELLLDLRATNSDEEHSRIVIEKLAPRSAAVLDEDGNLSRRIFFFAAPPADLRSAPGEWIAWSRFWAGLAASRYDSSKARPSEVGVGPGEFNLDFSTPFGVWNTRNVTMLPNDIVIFEFGGQICALDLPNRKLAMITRGHAPVVVPDNK